MPLHDSVAVGCTDGLASLQSLPQARVAPVPLQQATSGYVSMSESRNPKVIGSQSSSWSRVSQTSTLPGYALGSASSQSSPPQSIDACPSESASGVVQPIATQRCI